MFYSNDRVLLRALDIVNGSREFCSLLQVALEFLHDESGDEYEGIYKSDFESRMRPSSDEFHRFQRRRRIDEQRWLQARRQRMRYVE